VSLTDYTPPIPDTLEKQHNEDIVIMRELRVMYDRDALNMTFAAIAVEMKLSNSRIAQIYAKGRKKRMLGII
jgi:predicted DNA-binding protein (UPF0251 family)